MEPKLCIGKVGSFSEGRGTEAGLLATAKHMHVRLYKPSRAPKRLIDLKASNYYFTVVIRGTSCCLIHYSTLKTTAISTDINKDIKIYKTSFYIFIG